MAQYLIEAFGDKLVTQQFASSENFMPSPQDLMGKVIIKGKKLQPTDNDGEVSEDDEAHESENHLIMQKKKKVTTVKTVIMLKFKVLKSKFRHFLLYWLK